MPSKNPEYTGVGVWISSVECIGVVEFNHPFSSLFWGFGPFENALTPQHAQIIVDDSFTDQLTLGCIPDFIVGIGVSDLLQRVGGSLIISVFGEGDFGPVW